MNYYKRVKDQGWKKGDLIRTDYGLCLVTYVDLEPKEYDPRNWGEVREVMCDRDSYIWKWAFVEARLLTPYRMTRLGDQRNAGDMITFLMHPTRKQRIGGSVFNKVGCEETW